MRPQALILIAAVAVAVVAVVVMNPFHGEDPSNDVVYGTDGGDTTCRVSFEGDYAQYVVKGHEVYAPCLDDQSDKVFLGWSAGGGSYSLDSTDVTVDVYPGQKITVKGSCTYKPVWLSVKYDLWGAEVCAPVYKTSNGDLGMVTINSSTPDDRFKDFFMVYPEATAYSKYLSVTRLSDGSAVSYTIHNSGSFDSNFDGSVSAFGVNATSSKSDVKFNGDSVSCAYLVKLKLVVNGSTYEVCAVVYPCDDSGHTVSINEFYGGVNHENVVPYGTYMVCGTPSFDDGTSTFAWWYADFGDALDVADQPIYPAGTGYSAVQTVKFTAEIAGDDEGVIIYDLDKADAYSFKRGVIYTVGQEQVVLPASSSATKSGYKLGGWVMSSNSKLYPCGYSLTPSTDYTVMTAKWVSSSDTMYTVSFLDKDGNSYYNASNLTAGSVIPAPESYPTVYGMTFKGWSDGTSTVACGQDVTVSSSGNTYTAVYEASSSSGDTDTRHTVTFYTGSGGAYTRTVTDGTVVQSTDIPGLSMSECVLVRWMNGTSVWDQSAPVTSDLYLTPVWVKVFSLSIDGLEATVTMSSSISYNAYTVDWGDGYVSPETNAPTVSHPYNANTSGVLTVKIASADTDYNGKSASATYSVGSGGSGEDAVKVTVKVNGISREYSSDQTVSDVIKPSVSGLTFAGWYSDITLGTEVSEDTALYNGMTLYSKMTLDATDDQVTMYILVIVAVLALLVMVWRH